MKSYVKEYHRMLINMTREEAKEFSEKKIIGMPVIDMIPIGIMMNTLMDILQVFIPPLRLKEKRRKAK